MLKVKTPQTNISFNPTSCPLSNINNGKKSWIFSLCDLSNSKRNTFISFLSLLKNEKLKKWEMFYSNHLYCRKWGNVLLCWSPVCQATILYFCNGVSFPLHWYDKISCKRKQGSLVFLMVCCRNKIRSK